MKIAVIGVGYVGLVQAIGLAELGYSVTGVARTAAKIKALNLGQSPIYEPGLEELLKKNLKAKRINFTVNLEEATRDTDIIFIAVGTPSATDGSVDLSQVKAVSEALGQILSAHSKKRIIINKSTVPIGTGDIVTDILKKHRVRNFSVLSNPEFLREGQAVRDFFHPDRIVIGGGSPAAQASLKKLYAKLKAPVLVTDIKTAEFIKYAANAYLASSISFINSLSWLAEKVGADITQVAAGMRLDKRIGERAFLTVGPGYAGSCFPKDVKGLIHIGHSEGVHLPLLEAAEEINTAQRAHVFGKVKKLLGKLAGKRIAVWGLSFKAETDDIRESASIDVISMLLKAEAEVVSYDPAASVRARAALPELKIADGALSALKGADLLLIMTEWPQFQKVPIKEIPRNLKSGKIVDARNLFDPSQMKQAGLTYVSVGRGDQP